MNKVGYVSRITIVKEDFRSKEEFEETIKEVVMLLLNNGYIMTVRYDVNDKEMGVVVIDYAHNEETFGGALPYWLLPEEFESVIYESEKDDDSNGD